MEPTTEFSGVIIRQPAGVPVYGPTNCDYIEVEMYGKPPVRYYPDNRYIGLGTSAH